MLNVNYAGLKETELVAQATKDIQAYETGGQYSIVQLSDLQAIEKHLQRAEFYGVAGGVETRKQVQNILTRDAGIQFAKKSYIQPHQGVQNQKNLAQALDNKANRTYKHVGIRY